MNEYITFKELMTIDPLQWSAEVDPIGLLTYQNHKRKNRFYTENAKIHTELTDIQVEDYQIMVEELGWNLFEQLEDGTIRFTKINESGDTEFAITPAEDLTEDEMIARYSNLDEATMSPQQRSDFNKLMYGALSRDDYNKKWKLGKYKVAGNKLAGPGGLYKNLVKKEEVDSIDEALTMQQRMRRKMIMRRLAPRIARARKIAMRRRAGNDVLKRRARSAARKLISRKLLGGRNKADVSASEKARIEKIIAKRGKAIDRLAVKLMPKVRQTQAARFKNKLKKTVKPKPKAKPAPKPAAHKPAPKPVATHLSKPTRPVAPSAPTSPK